MRLIIRSLLTNISEFMQWMELDRSNNFRMKRFFGLCLAHAEAGDEFFVHAYVFIFWEDLRRDLILSKPLALRPKWASTEFGIENPELNASEEIICRQLKKASVEADLFTFDPSCQTLSLVEIKRGACDDRAIGQALRYFRQAWNLLDGREFRKMPVRYINFVMIANDFPDSVIRTLPFHFLASIEIVRYATAEHGLPVFNSARGELRFTA